MALEGYRLRSYRLSPIDILDLLEAITECVGGGKHSVPVLTITKDTPYSNITKI